MNYLWAYCGILVIKFLILNISHRFILKKHIAIIMFSSSITSTALYSFDKAGASFSTEILLSSHSMHLELGDGIKKQQCKAILFITIEIFQQPIFFSFCQSPFCISADVSSVSYCRCSSFPETPDRNYYA